MSDDQQNDEIKQESGPAMLQLGEKVPNFQAETTHGPLELYDWNPDSWVILFSHPADFTPVCTTEFIAFAERNEEFEQRNVKLLGNSVDSVHSHIAWVRNIKENFGVDIPFPIIADLDQKVARKFGMIHAASSDTAAIRAVYFIDPDRRLQAMIYYPLETGRNFDEILRVVDALQTSEERGVATPADWQPGDKVIVPPPSTAQEAEERVNDESLEVTDWYFSKKE